MKYFSIAFAGLMFFVLASVPNKAMAEETATNDWVTVWNAQADTLVQKGVVTMIDTNDPDMVPTMIKVVVTEVTVGTRHEVEVSKDFLTKAALGDTVTVLKRYGHEEQRQADGSVIHHLNLLWRYEVTVAKKK